MTTAWTEVSQLTNQHTHVLPIRVPHIQPCFTYLSRITCVTEYGGVNNPFLPLPPCQSTLGGSKRLGDVQYLQVPTCTCMATFVIGHNPDQPALNCPSRRTKQRKRRGLWASQGWLLEGRGPSTGSCSRGPPPAPHWTAGLGRGKKVPVVGR